jgi:hypothetical protein
VCVYGSMFFCTSSMWNAIPLKKCRRKFRPKFPGITVPSTTGIHELIKKVTSTGSVLDKGPAKKVVVTEENLSEIWDRLGHSTEITKTTCTRDRNLEISSSQRNEEVNFSIFKWYRDCVRTNGQFSAYVIKKRYAYFTVFMKRHCLVSRKSCSVWLPVMQFLQGAGNWRFHATMPSNAPYIKKGRTKKGVIKEQIKCFR